MLSLYENDLPSDTEQIGVAVMQTWQRAKLWILQLPHADHDYFPNIRTLMLVMVTLPVTSCERERSISHLRLIKSTVCTTMKTH